MQPHAGQPVVTTGPGIESSRAAMIMLHGRNAGPRNILELAGPLADPAFTYLAPPAAGGTWYPYSFMADKASNEPGLSSGLWGHRPAGARPRVPGGSEATDRLARLFAGRLPRE